MMASHDNDGDETEKPTSPFSLLDGSYKRLRLTPDEDGDIQMTDGDEMEVEEAEDAGSQSGLLSKISTAASAYVPSAVADTIRKFIATHATNRPETHIEDPACSPPDVKEPIYSKSEVQQINDSILAGSSSNYEPTQKSPISLRAHASLHPATPDQSVDGNGDDIPPGTLRSLLAARQHLEEARDEIITHAASRWIDIPDSCISSNLGSKPGSERRTLEPREDPKEVLMEILYPGEGKRILDWISEVGKGAGEKVKGRPWRTERRVASLAGDWKL